MTAWDEEEELVFRRGTAAVIIDRTSRVAAPTDGRSNQEEDGAFCYKRRASFGPRQQL